MFSTSNQIYNYINWLVMLYSVIGVSAVRPLFISVIGVSAVRPLFIFSDWCLSCKAIVCLVFEDL